MIVWNFALERKSKDATLANGRLDPNLASHALCNPLADVEAQTCSIWVQVFVDAQHRKRRKQLVHIFLADATPGVPDLQLDDRLVGEVSLFQLQNHLNVPLLSELECVAHVVHEDLLQASVVGADVLRELIKLLDFQFDVPVRSLRAVNRDDFLDRFD